MSMQMAVCAMKATHERTPMTNEPFNLRSGGHTLASDN